MTRRSTSLASLALLAALSACDAGPEGSHPGANAEPREPAQPETEPEPEVMTPQPADEDAEPDEDCEPGPVVLPRVMFVLDKSSSMTGSGDESSGPQGDDGPTRWAQLHALVGALADALESRTAMGAVLFPSRYAESSREGLCDVLSVPEAAVGPYRADDLMDRLPRAGALGFLGGSPAQAAYATALDHLASLGGSAPTAIVLVTDGGLNCTDDEQPLFAADGEFAELVLFARQSLQIQTFVIGVEVAPGDQKVPYGDPDAALREIALAGGAAHGERGYFSVDEALPLVHAIDEFVAAGEVSAAACG